MRLIGLLTLVLAGCPSSDDDDTNLPTDTGIGPDGCEIGKGTPDGGSILGPCNPGTGQGCIASNGQSCRWNVAADNGECVCPGATPNMLGATCSDFDCEAGTTCLELAGEGGRKCFQVCNTMTAEECDTISGADVFGCVRLDRGPMGGGPTTNFGVCRAVGPRCDPLADTCDMNQTCTIITRESLACLNSGAVPIGGDCTNENCAKGGICVPLVDANGDPLGINCFEPCNEAAPACTAGACTDVGLDFGICL